MIIFIALLFIIGDSHLIISVSQNNSTVSATQNINIRILTSAAINNNALSINLSTQFDATAPCEVNKTNVSCSYSLSATSRSIIFNYAFTINTFYELGINIKNPYYASNFQFTANAGGTSFGNSGVITIVPKVISCSLVPGSQLVGDVTSGYFNINNDIIPNNSIITINSTLQTIFNNLITSSPLCIYQNNTLPCSLSTNFQQQYLTINAIATNPNMIIQVNSINNPPYNDSFNDIGIQIQNSAGNYMQVCNFKQQAVTILRKSTSFSLANWNGEIGVQSSVTATLNTFFNPYSNQLIMIHPINWIYTLQTPSSSVLTGTSTISNNYITGATIIGKSLTFSAIVKNPPFIQPLNSAIYVVYSPTQFIQQFTITNFILTQIVFPLTLNLTQSRTFLTSICNISTVLPYSFSTGFIGSILISYGNFICSNLLLLGNYNIKIINCTDVQIFFESSDIVSKGNFWFSFSLKNYYSTRNNPLNFNLFGPSPNFYKIGQGTTTINLTPSNHIFTIVNSNTTFYSGTTIAMTQSNLINATSINRIFSIKLPIDIILRQNTIIKSVRNDSIINSYSVNVAQSIITINVNGILAINISNILNPIKYNGSLLWTITSNDTINNPSSSSTAVMTPMYTSTLFQINMTLSDTTIQNNATMTLIIVPTLQYYQSPTITLTLSNSLILTSCENCTPISSNMISFTYFAPIMRIVLLVKNNQHPFSNFITTTITIGSFVYQTNSLTYSLTPMTYSYTANQQGLFGTIGNIEIKIVKGPTQNVDLTFSNITVLTNPVCIICTNTEISISGIVKYFQSSIITLKGSKNNVTYAVANVEIKYICQSITDCQICVNQTNSLKQVILVCQQCYNSTFTANNLLYNNKCIQLCPISTYSNGLTCVPCKQLCYICDSQSCKQCLPNYYIYNNTCLGTCPIPLINNATHCISIPIKCPNKCIDCPYNNKCNACDANYLLLNDLCYSSCPNGYIASGSNCIQFKPPQQTKYFPFPFLITAFLVFIILVSMKCFEKRSLIMGNLIAFVSLVEIGTIIMTLNYTLQSSPDIITQFLCFVLLFSKILINLIFLIYFLKVIAIQDQFQQWLLNNQIHSKVYKFLIVLSTMFSFQIIRIIYSRLLGLHIFFGKFNTSLIFKPLNFFTIAYFITSGASLIILSVRNIINQNGYKTSIYFSSMQSIIIEAILLLICFIDNKKGYDSEFFEYQIYKVYNQYDHSNIQQVQIEEQSQNVGSMHQMLNAILPVGSNLKNTKKQSSLIRKNVFWTKKVPQPQVSMQNGEVQMDPIQQNISNIQQKNEDVLNMNQKAGIIQNQKNKIQQKYKQDLLKQKIIQDWKNMQKKLPKNLKGLKRQNTFMNKSNVANNSFSPKQKNVKNALKRSSSMNEIQLKLPQQPLSIPDKIKKHFQSSINNLSSNNFLPKKDKKKADREEGNKINNQIINNPSKSLNPSIGDQSNNSHHHLINQYQNEKYDQFHTQSQKIFNSGVMNGGKESDIERYQNRYNEGFNEIQPYEEYQNEIQQPSDEEESKQIDINDINDHASQTRFQNAQINTDFQNDINNQQGNNKKRRYIVNYRYEQGKQTQKQYRVKKRKVNRQTQKIYLQRLLVSDRKSKVLKTKKLQF